MCYGDEARPPAPPVQGEVGDHGDLLLTSADGTEFSAYHARPAGAVSRGIVILPDVRGLHQFYKDLALRFAEAGLHAIAIDYFGRSAGIGPREEDFPFREHVDKTQPETIAADVAAAVAWLRAQPGIGPIFTVGFCFGGSNSWAQSAAGHGLAGCMGFYGMPSRVENLVPRMSAPLLLLAAGADFTPPETVAEFADRVRAAGVPATMTVFDGMPHSFFDRTYAEHGEACERAWREMLSFMEAHGG
ncbi:MAG TPA: dienelactone hydrolase family protein [Micromonosporaceae bacterium]|jgi:carboxymethylenebutenolidase